MYEPSNLFNLFTNNKNNSDLFLDKNVVVSLRLSNLIFEITICRRHHLPKKKKKKIKYLIFNHQPITWLF